MRSVWPPLLAALACGAACGPPERPSLWPPARFPERLPQIVLPIRDPLEEPDLAVEATLEGEGGSRKTIWMNLDTGTSQSAIPASLLQDLQLPEFGADSWRTPGGPVHVRVASLPRLVLATLAVERLRVGAMPMPFDRRDWGLLGNSVLDQSPCEISWDRGTVTLNATPWPEEGGVRSWPLARGHRTDFINVRINGIPVQMTLDTGAMVSTIPKNLAARIGLVRHAVHQKELIVGAGALPAAAVFVADLEIGQAKLEGQLFVETENDGFAALGLPVLSSYELQILPRSQLLFKPRNPDMRATAAERVHRWPWMPSCQAVGCVRAHVDGGGAGGRVVLEFEAALPRPVAILFGCAESIEPDRVIPWGLLTKTEPPFHHLRAEVEGEFAQGAVSVPTPDIDRLLVTPNGGACHQMTVLDVVPVLESKRHPNEARVVLRR